MKFINPKTGKQSSVVNVEDITYQDGSSLKDKLSSQDKELNELKSNVKWIYKYGGVGSGGSSSGSGSSTTWYITASIVIDGATTTFTSNKTASTISISTPGTYSLSIKINRPNGGSFNISYSYNTGSGVVNRTGVASSENSWTITEDVFIGGNSSIQITATDGEDTVTATQPYLTSQYKFTAEFVSFNSEGTEISYGEGNSADLLIGNIKDKGAQLKLNYEIGVDATLEYSITDIEGNSSALPISIDLTESRSGSKYLNFIYDSENIETKGEVPENIINFLKNENNAGSYSIKLAITVTPASGRIYNQEINMTFYLIPSEQIYLKIKPETGIIYTSEQSDLSRVETYYTGQLSFLVVPYFGTNQSRAFRYSAFLDNSETAIISRVEVKEREESTCTLEINNVEGGDNIQQHKIRFYIEQGIINRSFTIYLYAKEINSELNWYPMDYSGAVTKPILKNYWKSYSSEDAGPDNNSVTTAFSDLKDSSTFQMTTGSDEKTFSLSTMSGKTDLLFSIGIMYSEINETSNPIASICSTKLSGSNEKYISIYYDKIGYGSTVTPSTYVDTYIPMTSPEKYGKNSYIKDNYHLISIYKRLVEEVNDNTRYYELCVYIDGVLEGVFKDWLGTNIDYNELKLYPANYTLNLIEVSGFSHSSDSKFYNYLNDAEIVRYWYTYKVKKLQVTNLDSSMLRYFEIDKDNNSGEISGPNLSTDNSYFNYVNVSSSFVNNISVLSELPVLVFQHTNSGSDNILEWLNKTTYTESEDIPSMQVTLLYSSGKSTPKEVLVDSSEKAITSAKWELDIQGSTTRGYRTKNFELSIVNNTDSSDEYLYTPNFNINDTDSFLPENSFTLKADAVDSGHCNNNTMGSFINKNTEKFLDAKQSNSKYGSHIKNCLLGFPVLIFLDVVTGGKHSYYYLGIYNFNLGRKSSYNLGYKDTSLLDELTDVSDSVNGLKENGGFRIYKRSESETYLDGVMTAEISDNDSYWDFSQYDPTIIYEQNFGGNIVDNKAMFGDIVTNNKYSDSDKSGLLCDIVEKISKSGGYLFNSIGKTFGPQEDGYHAYIGTDKTFSKNQVPDNTVQYKRSLGEGGNYVYTVKTDKTYDRGTETDLVNLIIGEPDAATPIPAKLDFQSLVEYYTICMAFGLLDSVQKNLNIKTWTRGTTWYTAFYDMDTCLGVNNEGKTSDYFAFSDFWSSTVSDDTIEYKGETVKDITSIKIYRDFYPDVSPYSGKGYDIPSSYLFAVAKYAKSVHEADINIYPNLLWAEWRSANGPLRNADYFLETHLYDRMKNVNELMYNYNYRAKYLSRTSNASKPYSFDDTNFDKFKGRRREFIRKWLDGRFHMMDAYFNLVKSTNTIDKLTTSDNGLTYTWEGSGKSEYNIPDEKIPSSNTDVIVLNSIFGNNSRFQNGIDIIVKAEDYSPLFIKDSSATSTKYLLEDNSNYYRIYLPSLGNTAYTLGGSSSWYEINSIDCFSGSITITSDSLKTLLGTSGTISSFSISMPSIQRVELTSSGYSGSLKFENNPNTPNLSYIDISNSAIELTVNGVSSLKTLKALNCNGATLNISNSSEIQELDISGRFNTVSISGVPQSLDFESGTSFTSFTSSTSRENSNTFTLKNDSTIETLVLSGYTNVTIYNCTKLKTVTITEATTVSITTSEENTGSLSSVTIGADYLESLNLTNNKKLESITLSDSSDKLTTLNLYNTSVSKIIYYKNSEKESEDSSCLDLSRFTNLSSFNIEKNEKVVNIQFSNIKGKPLTLTNSFSSCSNLERVYGNVVIDADSCFYGLTKFSIHGSDLSNVKWMGKDVYDDTNKKVLTPFEILSGKDKSTINSLNPDNHYQEGNGVTNMIFKKGSSVFYTTCCTVFDYYYFFTFIDSGLKSISAVFDYPQNTDWGSFREYQTSTTDTAKKTGSPNRYMFYNCRSVETISNPFYNQSGRIRLYSPTNSGGEITVDDGIFSPLVNCKSISAIFYSYTFIVDRFIFRRKEGNYVFTDISDFWFKLCVPDVNNLNYSGIIDSSFNFSSSKIVSTDSEYGNLTDFFINTPNVSSLDGFGRYSYFINYTKSNFTFPNNVSNYTAILVSTYATGEIKLNTLITDTNKPVVTKIRYSFRVSTLYNDSVGAIFYVTQGMFSKYTNLEELGSNKLTNSPLGTSDILTSLSFDGNGITKVIEGDVFPINLGLGSKLKKFQGLFYNMTYTGSISSVQLPGEMFKNCSNLEDISYAFYNIGIGYTLTSINGNNGDGADTNGYSNFKNCSKLKTCDYAFGNSDSISKDKLLTGFIPDKFFWHGQSTTRVTFTGTNSEPTEEENGTLVYDEQETIEHSYPSPTATISSMIGCFRRNNCGYYKSKLDSNNKMDSSYIENNPDYSPYKYLYSGGYWKTVTVNTKTKTFMHYYDGDPDHLPSDYSSNPNIYEFKDEITSNKSLYDVSNTVGIYNKNPGYYNNNVTGINNTAFNFCCPPDLFRYCTSNCDISEMFDGSGIYLSADGGYGGGSYSLNNSSYFGLRGRICPYLLYPVKDTENFNYFFRGCRALSWYKLNSNTKEKIFIPKTFFSYATKITSLRYSFAYIWYPQYTYFGQDLFKNLTGSLTIDYIFYQLYIAINDDETDHTNEINSVFRFNDVYSCIGAFSRIYGSGSHKNSDYPRSYVRFSMVFKDYTAKESDSKFSYVFAGHDRNYVTHENPITLANNETTYNYLYDDGKILGQE